MTDKIKRILTEENGYDFENFNNDDHCLIDDVISATKKALDLANVSNRFKTRLETKDGTWFLNSEEIKQWEDDGSIEKGDKSYKTVLLREY